MVGGIKRTIFVEQQESFVNGRRIIHFKIIKTINTVSHAHDVGVVLGRDLVRQLINDGYDVVITGEKK